jgi:hypothetical protein
MCISGTCGGLRDVWEATSFQLERLQAAPECVAEEEAGLRHRTAPVWNLPWNPSWGPPRPPEGQAVCVAVVRYVPERSNVMNYNNINVTSMITMMT